MRRIFLTAATILALGACATSQVSPVAGTATKRICVVENPAVRGDFIGAYRKALEGRGFEVRLLPEGSPPTACALTSTYIAHFWWDMVFYMRNASIDVYSDGRPSGRAAFEARGSRFFSTEDKVKELVAQLFPG